MSRLVVLDSERGEIRISFPYDANLLPVMRSFPGRRWDPSVRSWVVPADHFERVVEQLQPYGFSVEKAAFPSEKPAPQSAGPAQTAEKPDAGATAESTLGVLELNELVRDRLCRAFPAAFWVAGEIVGFDRNAHKRHVFFQLAEKQPEDDRPRAVVNAVLFERAKAQVSRTLKELGDDEVRLGDGVRVRVRARVDVYPATGSYQLVVEAIDPEFTLGAIALRRERIVADLEQRGLRAANSRRPFPRPSLRVGLITSRGSDAENDFLNELTRSGLSFDVCAFDVHVQGQHLERHVLAALRFFARRRGELDLVVIIRGGGASTDLMAFDTLPLGLAVAEHPLKIVVGIGHHRDRTVLDALAHSEKTPTAVGKRLVELAQAELTLLGQQRDTLRRVSLQQIRGEISRLTSVGQGLSQRVRLRQLGESGRLARLSERLRHQMTRRVDEARRPLDLCRELLPIALRRRVARESESRERIIRRLVLGTHRALQSEKVRLASQDVRVRASHPASLLARGYSWLTDETGRTVKSVEEIEVGATLQAKLVDGTLRVRVDSKRA